MKKVLMIVTRSPYGSSLNAEAFRAAIGMAFSDIDVEVVLMGDGTCTARLGQNPAGIGMKCLGDAYAQIEQFQTKLYIHGPCAELRKFKREDMIDAPVIGPEELKEKIAQADVILTF